MDLHYVVFFVCFLLMFILNKCKVKEIKDLKYELEDLKYELEIYKQDADNDGLNSYTYVCDKCEKFLITGSKIFKRKNGKCK